MNARLVVVSLLLVFGTLIHADDRVVQMPEIGVPDTVWLSGRILVNSEAGGHLYYLFAESRGNPNTDPTILWLQGGPGSSSLFGFFVENGPVIINATGSFSRNIYSWNQFANVLWIDQPVGTGFSYTNESNSYVHSEDVLSQQLLVALDGFFTLHPKYSHASFYIFGESYAGKYIPWLASAVLNSSVSWKSNLKGVGIGNGWVSPIWQAKSYSEFLLFNDRINLTTFEIAQEKYQEYAEKLNDQDYLEAYTLDNDMLSWLENISNIQNNYDIRTKVDPTEAPFLAMNLYLNRSDVQQALNIPNSIYDSGYDAYYALDGDEEQSALSLVSVMLNQGLQVLLYNGQYDLICNWVGTNLYATNLINWKNQQKFNRQHFRVLPISPSSQKNVPQMEFEKDFKNSWKEHPSLKQSQDIVGFYRSAANLTQVIVVNAGHMSPFDQPKAVQSMVQQFILGTLH